MSTLFSATTLAAIPLQNRLVMAPMTRNRAINNTPNALMAQYYAQRASAGMIITEGTSPSANGLGYARIPGIFSADQIEGWKLVTHAVHASAGKIFMQLMHCGRVGHPLNLPIGARLLAPSAIAMSGDIYTDSEAMQAYPLPRAMSDTDIQSAIDEYAQAAKSAIAAGFDGIELHGANGYLIEQFIRPSSNQRTDAYGGTLENRLRFVLDVVDAVSAVIGKDKVGIRLSPFGIFNDMPLYEAMEADYTSLAQQLNTRGLLYVHLVDHSSMGAPAVPTSIKTAFRQIFKGSLILSGGYDATRAEKDLADGKCDLIAVGRPFLANPDLPARWQTGATENTPDMSTFYSPGAKGYTDYPAMRSK
ncbi:alkene reductase [soil metagenome]